MSEYTLGVDVFDRRVAIYDTCDDPIVRVQVGRLRGKLQRYFETFGLTESLRLAIPIGEYVLLVQQTPSGIHFSPLRLRLHCISVDTFANSFTDGVNEELTYYMQTGPRHGSASDQLHAEGSLRIDVGRVRVSVRLTSENEKRILWTRQFDFPVDFSIAAQENIGRSLSLHLFEALRMSQGSNLCCNGGVTDVLSNKNLKSDR